MLNLQFIVCWSYWKQTNKQLVGYTVHVEFTDACSVTTIATTKKPTLSFKMAALASKDSSTCQRHTSYTFPFATETHKHYTLTLTHTHTHTHTQSHTHTQPRDRNHNVQKRSLIFNYLHHTGTRHDGDLHTQAWIRSIQYTNVCDRLQRVRPVH